MQHYAVYENDKNSELFFTLEVWMAKNTRNNKRSQKYAGVKVGQVWHRPVNLNFGNMKWTLIWSTVFGFTPFEALIAGLQKMPLKHGYS